MRIFSHGDKWLWQVIATMLLIVFAPLLAVIFVIKGLKIFLFTAWIIFAVVMFLLGSSYLIDKGIDIRQRGFLNTYIQVGINELGFKILTLLLLMFIVVTSWGVWTLLAFRGV